MRAVLVDEEQALAWSEVPDPVPKAGELLVDVHAAALNRADLLKAEILAALERTLWQSFSFGAIKPVIYKTLPVTQAEEAHAILQRRENIGKVVLTVKRNAQ